MCVRANTNLDFVSHCFDCYNKMYFKRLKLQLLVTSLQLFFCCRHYNTPCLAWVSSVKNGDIGVKETIIRLPYCLLRCRFKNDECALIVPEPALYCFVNLMKWGIRASFALSALLCKRNARLMQRACIKNKKVRTCYDHPSRNTIVPRCFFNQCQESEIYFWRPDS